LNRFRYPALALLWCTPLCATAQSSRDYTIEVAAGYLKSYVGSNDQESYYKILLHGKSFAERGQPIKVATHLDTVGSPSLGGQFDWRLRFENGTLQPSGGVFEGLGAKDLNLRGLHFLRGSALIAGDNDGKTINFAVGLESPQFGIPVFASGSEVANWFAVGVQAQRAETTDSPADANQGLITLRAFAGKEFGRPNEAAKLRELPKHQAQLDAKVNEVYQIADSKDRANYAIAHEKELGISKYTKSFLQAALDEEIDNWKQALENVARQDILENLSTPTFAAFTEYTSWYTFNGPSMGNRYKGLFTATIDYFMVPYSQDMYLRIRYESGFERGAPTQRKNNLMLAIAFKL